MTNLSLRTRSLLSAILALIVFIPAISLTLEQAFSSSLREAKYNELKLMSLAMITAFEFDDDEPFMPQQLFEEQLNLPGSGYIGFVIWNNQVVWRSLSALDYLDPKQLEAPDVGSEKFSHFPLEVTNKEKNRDEPFLYIYSAEYENNGTFEPVTFAVFNEQAEFQQERKTFMNALWQWLIVLSVALLAVIYLIGQRLLAPVTQIINNIRAAENGEIERLSEQYPPELESLKHSINQLLASEAQQRQRYKNSLGDLAHSLKTPLAVLMGSSSMPNDAKEPLSQIDNIIKRQLTRAVGHDKARYTAIEIQSVADKLINAMRKIHADKGLTIDSTIDKSLTVKCDPTDLTELLGNLLDNACKSAKSEVRLSASLQHNSTWLYVDDDGDGVNQAQADDILSRGKRLDTYEEGQGIGLSVVMDIIDSYDGQLHIKTSPLGGARFSIKLPR